MSSGGRLMATGQVNAAFFSFCFCRSLACRFECEKVICISAILLGLAAMILVISDVNPVRLIPSRSASMPMSVIMQLLRAAHTRSVGLKASPLPLLSGGASVVILLPDSWWVSCVRSPPRYSPVIDAMDELDKVFCVV